MNELRWARVGWSGRQRLAQTEGKQEEFDKLRVRWVYSTSIPHLWFSFSNSEVFQKNMQAKSQARKMTESIHSAPVMTPRSCGLTAGLSGMPDCSRV